MHCTYPGDRDLCAHPLFERLIVPVGWHKAEGQCSSPDSRCHVCSGASSLYGLGEHYPSQATSLILPPELGRSSLKPSWYLAIHCNLWQRQGVQEECKYIFPKGRVLMYLFPVHGKGMFDEWHPQSWKSLLVFLKKHKQTLSPLPNPNKQTNKKDATKIYLSDIAGIQPRLAFKVRHKEVY